MTEDILRVRTLAVSFYVLRALDGLYLIDTGFLGGRSSLDRALARRGWQDLPIRGILVTHGHLDHVFNVAALVESSGAWVAAPRLDREHYQGSYRYRGMAKVCGAMEAAGRRLFRYRPFGVDQWLDDGMELPIWRGLTVIHLPGHTEGHCGFYCRTLRALFCGDLFASNRIHSGLPPSIFNSFPERIPASVDKALSLSLDGIFPNHCDAAPAETHLARLRGIQTKIQPKH